MDINALFRKHQYRAVNIWDRLNEAEAALLRSYTVPLARIIEPTMNRVKRGARLAEARKMFPQLTPKSAVALVTVIEWDYH